MSHFKNKPFSVMLAWLLILTVLLAACGDNTATTAPATTAAATTAAATTAAATTSAATTAAATTSAATTAAGTTAAATTSAATTAAATTAAGTTAAASGDSVTIDVAGSPVTIKAGGGQTFQPSSPVTVTIWSSQVKQNGVALRGLLDEFQQSHPNIKVVHDNFNDTATYNDVNTKLKQSAQTNSLPNIAVGYQNWVPSFVDAKVALGLTQYISGPYGLSAKDLADYRPQMMARNVFPQYNNEIYTWVFGNSGPVLYYNEDLLKASGAKVPDPTWTWDDLVEASKAVTAKSNGASVGLLFTPKSVSEIVAGIYSRGGKVYDYAANKMVLTDKPAIDHLSMLYNGVKEGYFATADPNVAFDDQGSFEKGKSAFYISSTSSRSFIASDMAKAGAKQFSWNATVIPHGQGLQPLTTLYGGSTLAFKGKSAEQDNATWEVIKYMGSAAFQAKWASNSGYVPATKSTIDDPIYKAFLDKAPQNKIPLVVFDYAKAAEPSIGAWDQIRTIFDNNVFALFQNASGSPADTLKKIEDDSNKLLATSK
jgi:ABC-type glycerol-3-phosphate transport system substrate-binding protein